MYLDDALLAIQQQENKDDAMTEDARIVRNLLKYREGTRTSLLFVFILDFYRFGRTKRAHEEGVRVREPPVRRCSSSPST